MGLKAVANPAAGGQPGSLTTLTVTGAATIGGGLAVTGSVSATGAAALRAINATSDYTALQMGTASTVYGQIGWGTGGELVYNSAAGATRQHVFQTGGSNRAVIDSAGVAVTGLTTTDTLRVNVTPTAEVVVATHTAVFNINGTNYKFLCLAA